MGYGRPPSGPSRRLKVMYVVPSAVGGMARHVRALIAGLDRSGFEACLVSADGPGTLGIGGDSVSSWHKLSIRNELSPVSVLTGVLRLARAIVTESPDIVHFHGYKAGLVGRAAIRCAGGVDGKVVITAHNSPPQRSGPTGMWRVLGIRKGIDHAGKVVAVCESIRQSLLTYKGIPPERVVTIPNGVCLRRFQQPARMRGAGFVLGTVSRLVPSKGIDYLLKAAAILRREVRAVSVVIVGDGPQRPALQNLARDLGIADVTRFAGVRDDIPAMLGQMDVFVLPTLSEGLPLALLEAMASGRPVVASKVGGIPEVVTSDEQGFLVPPGNLTALVDSLVILARDVELSARMGANAAKRALAFDEAAMVKETQALYLDLMETEEMIERTAHGV